jgi:hypothetical protein
MNNNNFNNTFYLYSAFDYSLNQVFFSASKLSAFIPRVSKRFGTDCAKMMNDLGALAICYNNYIILIKELDLAYLKTNHSSFPVKRVLISTVSRGMTIYGHNPSTNTFTQ